MVLIHENWVGVEPPTLIFRTPGSGWTAPEEAPDVTGDYARVAALDANGGRLLLGFSTGVWIREPDGTSGWIATTDGEPVDAGFDDAGRWWLLSLGGSDYEAPLLEEQ